MSSRRLHGHGHGSAAQAPDQERLVNDRAQYVAFLEQQLERVSGACQNIQYLDEKFDQLKQVQNTYEGKMSNLAKLVKLDKQHTEKIKNDTTEYTDNLKKRLLFLEEQSRDKFTHLEGELKKLENMYSSFPTDASAIGLSGVGQPQGLPGFIAAYIHSLFTSHTQQTAQQLTHQSQTHQIHLQNWVQEYIKETHPSTKLTEEVNSFKNELRVLSEKVNESETRMMGFIENRMASYTEIYHTMEERFLSVIDVHHKKLSHSLNEHEERIQQIIATQEQSLKQTKQAELEFEEMKSNFIAHKQTTQNVLNVIDEMKLKLDSGILDFNTNMNNLVLETREKTWHAEQTCSRLSVDTLSRQEIFHKKIEAHLQRREETLTSEMKKEIGVIKEESDGLRESVKEFEKKMDKLMKKTEGRVQILAKTISEKLNDEPSSTGLSSSSSTGSSSPAGLQQLDRFVHGLDTKIDALRHDLESSQLYLKQECHRVTDEKMAALHQQLDKEIEDKIYLIERANNAHELAKKTVQFASGTAGDSSDSPVSNEHDWRALKSELNTELKKNLSAMQARLEEKLSTVEKKNMTTLEHSRTIGTTLQQLEEKSRAADDVLRKVQEIYLNLQQDQMNHHPPTQSPPSVQLTQSLPNREHRPASPTIYAHSNMAPAPPRPVSPIAPTTSNGAPVYSHPPAFAANLPYYHDPKKPTEPFLVHANGGTGAYVPSLVDTNARPNPIHTYPRSSSSPTSTASGGIDVRAAADSALARTLSPLRHRESSPPSLQRRYSPTSGIHHHATTDDLYLPSTSHASGPSKPYALIPSHFPPANAPTSYFDRPTTRSMDDSDLLTDKALTTGLGNIEQLLRSMEYAERVDKKKSSSAAKSRATSHKTGTGTGAGVKQTIPMKRIGGGFVAPNLFFQPASSATVASFTRDRPTATSSSHTSRDVRHRSKSPYIEDEDASAFLPASSTGRPSRRTGYATAR